MNDRIDWIDDTVSILKQGGVIGYPTETVYGLGGDALNCETVHRIYRLKRRDLLKPFIILIADKIGLDSLVTEIPQKGLILMERFWPGPLTLLLHASSQLPSVLLSGGTKIGVRISSDPVCQMFFNAFSNPLISTSANPEGSNPAQSAEEVVQYFPNHIDAVLDGGSRENVSPSTVLDVTVSPPVMIRTGSIAKKVIEDVIGEVYAF